MLIGKVVQYKLKEKIKKGLGKVKLKLRHEFWVAECQRHWFDSERSFLKQLAKSEAQCKVDQGKWWYAIGLSSSGVTAVKTLFEQQSTKKFREEIKSILQGAQNKLIALSTDMEEQNFDNELEKIFQEVRQKIQPIFEKWQKENAEILKHAGISVNAVLEAGQELFCGPKGLTDDEDRDHYLKNLPQTRFETAFEKYQKAGLEDFSYYCLPYVYDEINACHRHVEHLVDWCRVLRGKEAQVEGMRQKYG